MPSQPDTWQAEILEQLDEDAGIFDFPMPDNVNYQYGMMTLTAFRSTNEWLIAIDELTVNFSAMRPFEGTVFAFGNALDVSGVCGTVDTLYYDFAEKEDVNLFDIRIRIRGELRHFKLTKDDYDEAGAPLSMEMSDCARILRYLVWKMPQALRLTPDELLSRCPREGPPPDVFLRLEEWCHPDLGVEEEPSEKESFRSLARALAQNDPSMYSSEPPNTHWSNWPPYVTGRDPIGWPKRDNEKTEDKS